MSSNPPFQQTAERGQHLRDDRAAVRKARSELRMDGTLVIFVPAFDLLMSGLDRKLGHYRR